MFQNKTEWLLSKSDKVKTNAVEIKTKQSCSEQAQTYSKQFIQALFNARHYPNPPKIKPAAQLPTNTENRDYAKKPFYQPLGNSVS